MNLHQFQDYFSVHAPNPLLWHRYQNDIANILEHQTNIYLPALCFGFGFGSFLANTIKQNPQIVTQTYYHLLQQGPKALLADMKPLPEADLATIKKRLRQERSRLWAAMALAQGLGLWSAQDVYQTISSAADHLINQAFIACQKHMESCHGTLWQEQDSLPCSFIVFALGKLGAQELNFSSDVDLVFVAQKPAARSQGGSEGSLEGEIYLKRFAQLLTQVLDDFTADGFVFRVDLRLRPDGAQGKLVPSVNNFLDYYRSWSGGWERLALLRARPVAGNITLGNSLLTALEPLIYPRYLDFESLDDMRFIKDKIDREAKRRGQKGLDIKLGPGGIRELEFLVQNLQIIFAGKYPQLKTRQTLTALSNLSQAGIMPPDISQELTKAYCFLRQLENTLQALEDKQTQILPSGEVYRIIARALHFNQEQAAAEQLLTKDLQHYQNTVQTEFQNLYHKPDTQQQVISSDVYDLIEVTTDNDNDDIAKLKKLGFTKPDLALNDLRRLRKGPNASVYGKKSRAQYELLLPVFIAAILKTSHPDQALSLTADMISRIGGRSYLYALLRENPGVLEALMRLFASSLFLGRFFLQRPELLDSLVLKTYAEIEKKPNELEGIFEQVKQKHTDPEAIVDEWRKIRTQELLRIGLHDVNNSLSLFEVQAQLSLLADHILQQTKVLAFEILKNKYNAPAAWADDLIILALGKLGSQEMSYASDLDLIFITAPESSLSIEFAIRWAQKMISLLQAKSSEGFLYEVDMRLRPSGGQGLLVTTFSAFAKHHQTSVPWERVATIKHRVFATPQYRQAAEKVLELNYTRPFALTEFEEMLRITDKIHQERGHKEGLKAAAGGSSDIEIAIALVQLIFARKIPQLKVNSPWQALDCFALLPTPLNSFAPTLRQALHDYRKLENRLRLLLDRPATQLPQQIGYRQHLAQILGFGDVVEFEQHYAKLKESVYATFQDMITAMRTQLNNG